MKLEIHHGGTLRALRAGSDTEKSIERNSYSMGLDQKNSSVPPCLRGEKLFHRRDALWQVERAVRWSGPLLDELPEMMGNLRWRP
jgi:hypothetical protein